MKPVVRIAPSPTGNLHVGTVRTAIFNFLYAKKSGGKFIFRIEDTDKERSKTEFEDNMVDGLNWIGISWDDFYRQSERTDVYKKHLKNLLDRGAAYVSKEKDVKPGDREEVIRFKNPNKTVEFEDLIRGKVKFDTTDLGDFVIAKDENEPLYHLAVVIDDFESGVTHVIRGEEHISNTPRQILIQEALGAPRPVYAHLPLILDKDRKKLSKRAHGASVWIDTYREMGYLPKALINYFAFLGWNPGGEKEIFSLEELMEMFDITKVQKGGAIFDTEKLNWFNKEHMNRLPEDRLRSEVRSAIEVSKKFRGNNWGIDDAKFDRIWRVLLERVHRFGEITELLDANEFDYFFVKPEYDTDLIYWKGEKDSAKVVRLLSEVKMMLENVNEDNFTTESVKDAIWAFAEKEGKGSVLWPLRVALSGREKSPDPFVLANILGKTETLDRIDKSIELLSK